MTRARPLTTSVPGSPFTPAPIRLIGLPTDINGSFMRGPAKGPAAIRQALFCDSSNPCTEAGLALGTDIPFVDAGDLPLDETPADDARITAAVAEACAAGAIPLSLGGDHAVTFPILRGIAQVHGPVSLLHVDAHPDLYDSYHGNRRSHASPFARIMEAGLAGRLVQIGVRAITAEGRAQAARFGVEIVPMRGFAPDKVPVPTGPIYVSIDLDGLDPAFAPGVSHFESGGLSVREVLDVLDRIEGPLVGADVVELNPDRDPSGVTAYVAAKLVRELAGVAFRGRGGPGGDVM